MNNTISKISDATTTVPEIAASKAPGNNRPAYDALLCIKGENPEEVTWQKIGAAWNAKDGRGLNLVLNEPLPFVPDGKQTIYLRAPKPSQTMASQAENQ